MKLLEKLPINKIEIISLLISYGLSISINDIILKISFFISLYIVLKLLFRNVLNFDLLPY